MEQNNIYLLFILKLIRNIRFSVTVRLFGCFKAFIYIQYKNNIKAN